MPPQMPIAPDAVRNYPSKAVKATKHRRLASMKWCPVTQSKFRIGIVVGSRNMGGVNRVLALANPASSCCLVALTFLDPDEVNVEDWCKRHKKVVDTIPRDVGLDQLLQNPEIDGVYITGSNDDMTNIIEKALQAGKHVLVDDPVTTSVQDYCRLINLAHSQKKHLQDTTMFVYHHAVREFLTCILDEAMFGEIKKVDACFDIDSEGARFRGIASDEQRGCIDDLCRYCVVLGLLVFQRSRRKAISAQVTKVERDNQGFPMHCICRVQFEGGALLTVNCSYLAYAGTRQSVDVHSDSHSASMGDFVFSSHSLACFRVYEKHSLHGHHLVKRGESIDVDGGPLQEVSVWRRFAELSTNAYIDDEIDGNTLFDRYDFTFAAVQSQNIVEGLRESVKRDLKEVLLSDLDLEIPVK